MTRTPQTHRETLFGILSQREIETMITDNLAVVQKYVIRQSAQLPLTQTTVQRLHALLCGNLYPDAGRYRTHNVQLGGFEPPAYFDVPVLMKNWEADLGVRLNAQQTTADKIDTCAWMIHRFLWIHPFFDYNGRLARLLGEIYLIQRQLPIVDFRKTRRTDFVSAVKAATATGELDTLKDLLAEISTAT